MTSAALKKKAFGRAVQRDVPRASLAGSSAAHIPQSEHLVQSGRREPASDRPSLDKAFLGLAMAPKPLSVSGEWDPDYGGRVPTQGAFALFMSPLVLAALAIAAAVSL